MPIQKARGAALTLFAIALGVSASIRAMADESPLPPPRPAEPSAPGKAGAEPPPQAPDEGAASTCLAKLIAGGAGAEAATVRAASVEGCGIGAPVRLSSIRVMGGDVVSLPDRPLLGCEFAAVLAVYVRLIVAPLGEAMLRAKVASIETGPGYECRSRDRDADSAHAKGLAVDFFAVEFDGQAARPSGASGRRGRNVLCPRDAVSGLRLVYHRPRPGRRHISR
jgi:hypothetical protein